MLFILYITVAFGGRAVTFSHVSRLNKKKMDGKRGIMSLN